MTAGLALMPCGQCGWAVYEGPQGGYVCPQCFYTVEPPREPTRLSREPAQDEPEAA